MVSMRREFRVDVVMTRARRARAHDNIEVINLRAQRRSTSELPVTSTCIFEGLFEYIEYSYYWYLPRFHVVLQVQRS